MYDKLIRNATVIDGTGAPAFRADVAIRDGKLILHPQEAEAIEIIDATGLTLCPGFIDVHSHGDRLFGTHAGQLSKTNQGITTELAGQCGSTQYPFSTDPEKQSLLLQKQGAQFAGSPEHTSLEAYLRSVNPLPKTCHFGIYIGHSTIRISAMGFAQRKPTEEELNTMKSMVREAMEHGAMGMSSGLIYAPSCYADEEELVELCKIVAEYGGFYATHMRNEAEQLEESVAEAIRVAERSGCKLDISHHKVSGRGNWGKSVRTLQMIRDARARGVDVTADVYPYTASSTGLNVCLPASFFSHGPEAMQRLLADPAVRAQLKQEILQMDGRFFHCGGWDGILVTAAPKTKAAEGMTVQDYADSIGQDAFEAFFDLVQENGVQAQAIYFAMGEEDMERIVCDDNTVIGTDGVVRNWNTPTHPRGVAAFPKAIRYFVREKKLLTMEAMIHKMTGLPAERFGLRNKGIIADGMDADLLLINPETIADCATYTDSLQLCDGIEQVIVAGQTVYHDKQLTGLTPGQFIPYHA